MFNQKNVVSLEIADTVFSITSKDQNLLRLIGHGFKGFSSRARKPHVTINLKIREDFVENPYEFGRPHSISVDDFGDHIAASGVCFSGWLNLKKRIAEASIPRTISAFYLFLRFVTIALLSKNQGLIIHASSVAYKGLGLIFSGKPNSGKTTMAKLSSGRKVLCDDFSIIKKVQGNFRVFPSPFWGRVKPGGRNENDSYPIAGIYFLYHSDENFIRPLQNNRKKFTMLHQNTITFPTSPNHTRTLFQLETELIEKVPVYKLYFLPRSSVWRCING